VAGLGAIGLSLAFVFNPVAIGITGGYVLASQIRQARTGFRKRSVDKLVRAGRAVAISQDEPASQIAAEISKQLGRPQPPEIYILRGKGSSDPGFLAAIPGTNSLLTTQAFLRRGLTEPELRFAIAHEISHLQVDNKTVGGLGQDIVKQAVTGIEIAAIVTVGAALIGLTVPFLASGVGFIGLAALAAIPVARAAQAYHSRIRERRADRNALYITRDPESARTLLAQVDATSRKKPSLLKEIFLDHPSYGHRMKSITKIFNKKVSKAPELAGTREILAAQKLRAEQQAAKDRATQDTWAADMLKILGSRQKRTARPF